MKKGFKTENNEERQEHTITVLGTGHEAESVCFLEWGLGVRWVLETAWCQNIDDKYLLGQLWFVEN